MDYQIKPLGKLCSVTGKPLVPGSTCRSAVVEQNGQLVRIDFSPEAWTGPPDHCLGDWETHVPEQSGPPKLDADQLMRYLEQLSEEASPSQDETRYLLSMMLLQQRRLRLETIRSDELGDVLVLSGLRGEGTFEVPHLQLADADMSERQLILRKHLAAEWSG